MEINITEIGFSYIITMCIIIIFNLSLYRKTNQKKFSSWSDWMLVSVSLGIFWPIEILLVIMLKIMGVKND